jgi:hypothetical protein
MKHLIVSLFALVMVFSTAEAKNCSKGKACGNSCIAKDAVCKQDDAKPAKNCKKGKACGDTCIAKDAVCKK